SCCTAVGVDAYMKHPDQDAVQVVEAYLVDRGDGPLKFVAGAFTRKRDAGAADAKRAEAWRLVGSVVVPNAEVDRPVAGQCLLEILVRRRQIVGRQRERSPECPS